MSLNTEASFYLVEGRPAYLGTHAKMVFSPFGRAFLSLPDVARTGVPAFEHTADVSDNPFWEELVLAIVPLALPVAQALVERTDFSNLASPRHVGIVCQVTGGGDGVPRGRWGRTLARTGAPTRASSSSRGKTP